MTETLPDGILDSGLLAIGPPVQLYLELTTACNLRCTHCYLGAGEDLIQYLPSAVVHDILLEFYTLGGVYVSFSGGEPSLHPNWRSVVSYAANLGLECTFITNGVQLSFDDIEYLTKLKVHIAISLDGACPETNDAIRGPGSFAKTIRTMKQLTRLNLPHSFTICFTPMVSNYHELPTLLKLAADLGTSRVYLSLLENRGRAAADFELFALSLTDKRKLIFMLFSLQGRYPHISIQCTNLRYFTERLHGIELDGDDLDRTIRVTAEGNLFLTAYLDAEPFFLGRYQKGYFKNSWYSIKVQTAMNEAFRRRRTVSVCKVCSCWNACKGGSAALAWAYHHTFDAVDGYCEAKQAVFKDLKGNRF